MPLRDHFRPPISAKSSWEGLHGGWPMTMVQQLSQVLPENYTAEPRVHLGSFFELDVNAYEGDRPESSAWPGSAGNAGTATALWAAPQPTLTLDADLAEQYEYAVEIYDHSRGRRLVAAVEIVSPGNKDRPESRRAFATKCAALLQQHVSVSIVDLVTVRNFNLYQDILKFIDRADPAFLSETRAIYAATCRARSMGSIMRLETWAYPLKVGQPLPILPLWLTDELAIGLDLEASYEDACRSLRIA